KTDLVREVIAFRANRILTREQGYLERVDTLSGLDRWRVAVVQRVTTRRGAHGCELGSLVSELADQDEDARVALARHFASWETLLVAALERMRDKQVLRDEADPRTLATGIMAALQGGYLIAQMVECHLQSGVHRGAVFRHLRSYAASQ